jgi:hypothetical protein
MKPFLLAAMSALALATTAWAVEPPTPAAIPTDHSYSDKRIQLESEVIRWLDALR